MMEIKCDNCGKITVKNRHKDQKNYFCNRNCQTEYNHKKLFEIRKCEICEKEFEASKKDRKKYCSLDCQIEWQRKNPKIGKNHPSYKHDRNHTLICEWCNKSIEVGAYRADHGQRFCSLKCKREWYAKVWSQTEEWKQNRREYAVSQLENGENPNVNSAPQIIINNLLNDKNIQYKNEKTYINFAVDNYLINENLIIEIMGTYFHCDIRKYDKIEYSNQVTRIRMDKIKHSCLFNNEKIQVLYLWEFDVHNNLSACEKLIDEYIMNNGILLNYHSINYSISNDILCLNDNILIPYMDWDIENLNKIISIETKEKRSHKQQDKWTQFNCEFCGKEKEELTSHYIKKERHFCCNECFNEYKKNNNWHRRKPLLANE